MHVTSLYELSIQIGGHIRSSMIIHVEPPTKSPQVPTPPAKPPHVLNMPRDPTHLPPIQTDPSNVKTTQLQPPQQVTITNGHGHVTPIPI